MDSPHLRIAVLLLLGCATMPGQETQSAFDAAQARWRLGGSTQEAQVAAALAWAKAEPAWDTAHANALAWLVRSQQADGSWVAEASFATAADAQAGKVAASALAILALETTLSNMRAGTQRNPIKRAVAWLRSQQQRDGWFVDTASDDAALAQALAAMAITQSCVESSYRLLEQNAAESLGVFGAADRLPGGANWSLMPATLALCSVRRFSQPPRHGLPALDQSIDERLLPAGVTDVGKTPSFIGALPGTQEMASLMAVMALSGTPALGAEDPRLATAAIRVTKMTTRFGRSGELLDAATVWLGTDVAWRLGGEPRTAWRGLIAGTVLAIQTEDGHADAGSFRYGCGLTLLHNRTAETAMTMLALAVPWDRIGR